MFKYNLSFEIGMFVCFKGRIESVFAEFPGVLMRHEAIEMIDIHNQLCRSTGDTSLRDFYTITLIACAIH